MILPGPGKHYREAVLVAIESDSLQGATEVGKPCDIAWRYAISNDTLNALKWANVSADRGFQNYNHYLLNDEFNTRDFEITGISLYEDKAFLEKFLLEKRIEWPTVFSGDGWCYVTKELYGVRMGPVSSTQLRTLALIATAIGIHPDVS